MTRINYEDYKLNEEDEAEDRHLLNQIKRIAKWYGPRCLTMSREELYKVDSQIKVLCERRWALRHKQKEKD